MDVFLFTIYEDRATKKCLALHQLQICAAALYLSENVTPGTDGQVCCLNIPRYLRLLRDAVHPWVEGRCLQ